MLVILPSGRRLKFLPCPREPGHPLDKVGGGPDRRGDDATPPDSAPPGATAQTPDPKPRTSQLAAAVSGQPRPGALADHRELALGEGGRASGDERSLTANRLEKMLGAEKFRSREQGVANARESVIEVLRHPIPSSTRGRRGGTVGCTYKPAGY